MKNKLTFKMLQSDLAGSFVKEQLKKENNTDFKFPLTGHNLSHHLQSPSWLSKASLVCHFVILPSPLTTQPTTTKKNCQ